MKGHLKIQGIGPFTEPVEIDFDALPSPCAITGRNGSGKTTLMEAATTGATHAFFPSHPDSPYDSMTDGGNGHASIERSFTVNGDHYRVLRTLRRGNSQSHQAWLYRNDASEAVAGPKVSDVEAVMTQLLGSAPLRLATTILSQSARFDLVGNPGDTGLAAKRRAVFAEMLHFERIEAAYNKITDHDKLLTDKLRTLEAQLEGRTDGAEAIERMEAAIAEGAEREVAQRAAIERAQADLTAAEKRLADLEAEARRQSEVEARRDKLTEAHTEAKRDYAEAKRALIDAQDRAARLATASDDVERRNRLLDDREALRGCQAARNSYQEECAEVERVRTELQNLEERLETARMATGIDDKTRELAGNLDALATKRLELAEWRADVEERMSAARHNRDVLAARIDSDEAAIKKLHNRAAARLDTPGGAACETCPLLAEWTALPEQIEALDGKLVSQRAEHARLDDQSTALLAQNQAIMDDEKEVVDALNEARVAGQAVKNARTLEAEAARLADQIEEKRHDYDAFCEGMARNEEITDPTAEIDRVQQSLDLLAGAAERLADAQRAADALDGLSVRVDGISERMAKLANELTVAEIECARLAPATLALKTDAAASEANRLGASLTSARQSIDEILREGGRLASQHAAMIERRDAYVADIERLATMRTEALIVADLRKCFGPNGARQLLIDDAAAKIEPEVDSLMRHATDGRMGVRIVTQKLNKDGSIAEDFGILIQDQRRERDAVNFSKGERQVCRLFFRIGIALWDARRRNIPVDQIFADEAFDGLDSENVEALLNATRALSEDGVWVGLLTHDPQIAARMASRIRVENNGLFSTVEVSQ